jgi:hypothetical protein
MTTSRSVFLLNSFSLLLVLGLIVYTKLFGPSVKSLFLHPPSYPQFNIALLTHTFQTLCSIPPIICAFSFALLRTDSTSSERECIYTVFGTYNRRFSRQRNLSNSHPAYNSWYSQAFDCLGIHYFSNRLRRSVQAANTGNALPDLINWYRFIIYWHYSRFATLERWEPSQLARRYTQIVQRNQYFTLFLVCLLSRGNALL